MEKNYYDILGLPKDASDKEIKKKFRELSRVYHPDRQVDKSEQEKKDAEEKFKEINQAYSILSDPEKRSNYDQFGSADGMPQMNNPFSGFNPFGGGFNPFDFNPFGHNTQPKREVGKDIQIKVNISLPDLFNGVTKKIKYTRPVKCVNCHGTGGSGVKICPECGGTGMKTERRSIGPNSWAITNSECKRCHGTGKIVEHKCPTCNGDGLTKEPTTVEINIPAGFIHNNIIRMRGYGTDAKSKTGVPGDLVAIINYDFLGSSDLEVSVENNRVCVVQHIAIPYYDLLLGTKYNLELPYGGSMDINIPRYIQDGYVMTISNNKGAKYSIAIHYKFPEIISEEEKKHIEAIRQIHNNNI